MKNGKINDFLMNMYYLSVVFIGLALISSLIIMLNCVQDSNLHNFNSWQFPMLLALFFDACIVLYKSR